MTQHSDSTDKFSLWSSKALRRLRALLVLVAIPTGDATAAEAALAPTGTLRAAYIVANVAQARHDPVTGTFTGVVADITRELGRKTNVAVTIMPLPTAASVLEAVKNGSADIGFVAPNPDRSGVLFSQTYVLVQQSALVRADSPLVSVKDLDRPGRTIGVNTDDTVGVWLQQHLNFAKVRATSDYTMQEPFHWLREGIVDAFAGGRQRLASRAGNEPQLRMLPDNLYGVAQSIAVPSNRPERLALINTALDAMREDGFLADSVRRSGIDGLAVAPAEMSRP
ncbi:transporter substrate-binding domain-containing protein [Cupriavidus sp. DF5525]|uniref:transporter substrate-binding domain-containing protein n=1 Tax=Cupriavidus sp. DF5525 TaxID=3160989 RepID=UPI0032E055DD